MEEHKNKLVIIGNGFDLAHGLKTSYNDFIKWYLLNICEFIKREASKFEDELIEVKLKNIQQMPDFIRRRSEDFKIEWFYEVYSSGVFNVKYKAPLLGKLLDNYRTYSWIDIETEYYESLIEIFYEGNKPYNNSKEYHISEVRKLNSEFEFFKKKLEEYLSTIECNNVNQDINSLFQSDYCDGYSEEDKKSKIVHYLNFNYTDTVEKYIVPQTNHRKNYIHGKLKNQDNPIIFGYGDEIDSHYEKIQNLNINEFLNNFKSFGYFKTDNYSNLLRFIESEPFDVEILGHSCGLSDRVLLNTIFEHDNCESIKIHYYQKSETENDFLSKTQEISRHFKDKAKMRKRIVNFKDCSPLVKFRK
ncbi:AbiH family protein [Emticicia sp. W12TSBA100-4]|uniref:AbiH family protein n=1 Tax=Emticicia sp. W12TSBA100-4 TaxID=3160965 RepID=UPI00330590D3